ncbi:MAG: hypothetical protein Q8O14_14775 [bacterium]|nr:hypothetical protein [bacterium]
MASHPATGHFFLGRPYIGTTESLIAIDKAMRAGAMAIAKRMNQKLPPEVRQRRARARVRKHIDTHWQKGTMDGIDLLAWLRTQDWTAIPARTNP